ncbi:MAG: TrmB family transcriptional regulator [Candidatus Aenigmarchaeota archaeon]|nr:TrmB family transcriptional regulator [Candidatus Aenigmarchaeota archaeon]
MEEKIINALKDFGLTDYEARVYYAVCISKIAPATELSKLSEVPRARIYDILSTLARKGWVNILEGTPTKYTSSNFNIIKKKVEEKENKLKKSKTVILEEIEAYSKGDEEVMSEAAQELILGKENVMKVITNLIQTSKSEIVINYFSDRLLNNLFSFLKDAKKRGVGVKIILNSKQKFTTNIRKMKKLFKMRKGVEGKPKHGGLLIDKRHYLNIFESKNDINAVAVYYKKCILCLNAWLNRVWEESEKI